MQANASIATDLTIQSLPFLENARFRVVSNSMSPLLRVNDWIKLQQYTPPSALKIGDIVMFRREDSLVIHRIIAISAERLVTKGDRYTMVDASLSSDQVLAVVSRVVKGKIEINLHSIVIRKLNYLIAFLSRLTVKDKQLYRLAKSCAR